MAEVLVAELVIKGIFKIASTLISQNAKSQDVQHALLKTEKEVNRMSGIVENLRYELSDLRETISRLSDTTRIEVAKLRKDKILKFIKNTPDSQRGSILSIILMIQTLLEDTSVETISFEMKKVVPDEDSEEEEEDQGLCTQTFKTHFARVHTPKELTENLVSFVTEGEILTGIKHHSAERVNIYVSAAAPAETELIRLAEATGALYQFVQTMCDIIEDPRGICASAHEDGLIARSSEKVDQNYTLITLRYDWPTPTQLGKFEELVRKVHKGERNAARQLSNAIEEKVSQQKIKNIYLVGQTGEGKSTLANKFTGSLIQPGGALEMDDQIMVWDTPGMNDEHGLDQVFENKMYAHLNREQTVSAIFVVSKDGSRFPNTLSEMIRLYRKAFGTTFLNCVCVLIGISKEKAHKREIKEKRIFWQKKMSSVLGESYKLSRDKIFFYNARDDQEQVELQKIREYVKNSENFLSGTGNMIYQGLLSLREEQDQLTKDEIKRQMREASVEISDWLLEEVMIYPRIKFIYDNRSDTVRLVFVHGLKAAVSRIFRFRVNRRGEKKKEEEDEAMPRRKEIKIGQNGERATRVFKAVGYPMMGMSARDRFNYMMLMLKRAGLILTKMESDTEVESGRKIQVQNYLILDVENNLDAAVYERIESILKNLVSDRHVSEYIIDALQN